MEGSGPNSTVYKQQWPPMLTEISPFSFGFSLTLMFARKLTTRRANGGWKERVGERVRESTLRFGHYYRGRRSLLPKLMRTP